jgi:hypothetical protein
MQAARRAAVASSWASAAVGSTPMSKPTAASIPLQLLIMTISLRVHRRPVSIQARYAALLRWNLFAFFAFNAAQLM